MINVEYTRKLKELEDIRYEIDLMSKKTRNRNNKVALKSLKRKEKQILKDINNCKERFKKEEIIIPSRKFINLEETESDVIIPSRKIISMEDNKSKKNIKKTVKRRLCASFALLGTAISMLTGIAKFSQAKNNNLDEEYETTSISQSLESKKDSDKIKIEEISKPEEDNGIKASNIEFDTLVYNSQFTVKEDAKIYDSVYNIDTTDGFTPYFDSSQKRTVVGVTFEKNGELIYQKKIDGNSYIDMHELLCNGAKVVSVVTTVDGNGCEGAYKISDIDVIYPTKQDDGYQKVLK